MKRGEKGREKEWRGEKICEGKTHSMEKQTHDVPLDSSRLLPYALIAAGLSLHKHILYRHLLQISIECDIRCSTVLTPPIMHTCIYTVEPSKMTLRDQPFCPL